MRSAAGAAMLAAGVLALEGCYSCTLMYAPSQVSFTFDGGAWDPGLWQVEVNGYTMDAMCVVTLPYVEGDVVSCTSNATLAFDADGGISGFNVAEFHPDGFQLTLDLDGAEVYAEAFTPEYDVDEPNGPHCGERYVADFTVEAP